MIEIAVVKKIRDGANYVQEPKKNLDEKADFGADKEPIDTTSRECAPRAERTVARDVWGGRCSTPLHHRPLDPPAVAPCRRHAHGQIPRVPHRWEDAVVIVVRVVRRPEEEVREEEDPREDLERRICRIHVAPPLKVDNGSYSLHGRRFLSKNDVVVQVGDVRS